MTEQGMASLLGFIIGWSVVMGIYVIGAHFYYKNKLKKMKYRRSE